MRYFEFIWSRQLSMCAVIGAIFFHTQVGYAGDQTLRYTYKLQNSQDAQNPVCAHMTEVLNKSFSALWDTDWWSATDANFAADGKYAFPLIKGVEHQGRATFDMRLSKVPSSPEFDAIPWSEGRALVGLQKSPVPILMAYFDFDNDGHIDTVIKLGFSRGYDYTTSSGNVFEENLVVFRGKQVAAKPILNLQLAPVPGEEAPVVATAMYERPFVHQGRTYVAQYDEDLGNDFDAGNKSPYKPTSETMTILSYEFSGSTDPTTGKPSWDQKTICTFSMMQTNSSGREVRK